MRRLSRAIKTASQGGATLPTVWRSLADQQINVRYGEVSMIAGPPGAGKSTLALALAVYANVPTLYISADTHSHTMSLRLISMITNRPQLEVEPMMEYDREWAGQMLRSADHIMWEFDSSPTLKDIEDAILASRERLGEDVKLIVLDNAIDVTLEGQDEWGGLRTLMKELKWWARETGAAVVVCHHTSEGVQGNPCPPRSALHGKIAHTPSLILTVTSQSQSMGVCSVKNRYGPADVTGGTPVWLMYNPANMQVQDWQDLQQL
jgi:predicted ATP-dependent serine protease